MFCLNNDMGGHMRKHYQESSNIEKIHSLDDKDSAERSSPLPLMFHFCSIKGHSCSWVLEVDFCLEEQQLPTLSEDWSPWVSDTFPLTLAILKFEQRWLASLKVWGQAPTKFALWVAPSTVFYKESDSSACELSAPKKLPQLALANTLQQFLGFFSTQELLHLFPNTSCL